MNTDNNLILNSLRGTENEVKKAINDPIPAGYIEIKLSTNGHVGAPAVVHVRNFKVKDIMALSLTENSELPARLIQILNGMIYESTDVATWHEKEVEELMVYIFLNFYNGILRDVEFPVTNEDLEYLKNQGREDLVKDIKDGKWKPVVDINIARDASTYTLPDDFKTKIKITNKKTGFNVTFDYVKYGDQLVIKKWLDKYYQQEEKKFDKIKKNLEFNNSLSYKADNDPSVLDKRIYIDPIEQEEYENYISDRIQTLTEIVKIISIVDYNGTDVSTMPLTDKYELLSKDARIDFGMISKLSKRQQKYQFGMKPEVQMVNPITKSVCSRPFTFRLPIILSALQLSGDDDYDDGYDDEN